MGSDFSVCGKKCTDGRHGESSTKAARRVEYFELDMMEDESTPPRSMEESTTWPNVVGLLSGLLKSGGGAKASV